MAEYINVGQRSAGEEEVKCEAACISFLGIVPLSLSPIRLQCHQLLQLKRLTAPQEFQSPDFRLHDLLLSFPCGYRKICSEMLSTFALSGAKLMSSFYLPFACRHSPPPRCCHLCNLLFPTQYKHEKLYHVRPNGSIWCNCNVTIVVLASQNW